VDFVAVTKNERGHFGVPKAGLMSEMDASFQHFSHGCRHVKTPKVRSEPVLYCTKSTRNGQHLVGTGLGFADRKNALANLEQKAF
jgi:hypothetical protein